jgi:hypothetical protein
MVAMLFLLQKLHNHHTVIIGVQASKVQDEEVSNSMLLRVA